MDEKANNKEQSDQQFDYQAKFNSRKALGSLLNTCYHRIKPYRFYALVSILVLVSYFVVFKLLQSETVYNSTLRHITLNYVNNSGEITLEPVPYTQITSHGLDNWDARHYRTIRDNGYLSPDDGFLYLYAFFPLFPYIWKLTGLDAFGIIIVNFLMFSLSLMVLFSLYYNLGDGSSIKKYLMLFCIPLLVVFFMPYTEATFFITLSIAFYGIIKNNYYIYFIGMFAAAMTRSVIVILIISFFLTYFLFLLRYKNYTYLSLDFVKKIAPAILGTLAVVFLQYVSGSQKLFVFIDALQTWDNKFRFPRNLTDWSHESFSIAVVIVSIMVLVLAKLGYSTFRNGLSKSHKVDGSFFKSDDFSKSLLFYFSLIYTAGVFLTIFLFKGGSLNGIPRYVLCSPSFFIIIFATAKTLQWKFSKQKTGFFIGLTVFSTMLITTSYSGPINFSDFGMVLFLLFLWLWYFFDTTSAKVRLTLLIVLIVASVVWNTFLFNNFLVNGWIFT